jgi:DNA-binding GntR family transcriptional regulator
MSLDSYILDLPFNAPKASDTIARLLRQAILDGALSGGAVLRQEEIARKFGVSRVPVREAFHKLEGEGLVHTQPRRGVVVTPLVAEDFEEILEMRLALESLALKIACAHFTQEDLDAALQIVAQAEAGMQAPDANRTFSAEFESRWGELNWKFHQRLYAVARRPRLLAAIEGLNQQFARHLRARVEDSESTDHESSDIASEHAAQWTAVMEEHRQMALACARHDSDAAIAILRHHISDRGTELVRQRLRIGAGQ